jgi:hypothetical protein
VRVGGPKIMTIYTLINDTTPEIVINENNEYTESVYPMVTEHGDIKLTIRRRNNGRVYDCWLSSNTNLIGGSINNIYDALALLLARHDTNALTAFVYEFDYDGADTSDPYPETEFVEFCEAVHNYIASKSKS